MEVNAGGSGDSRRLCLRRGVGVCISMSGIPGSRAGVALGRQGVPSLAPVIFVGVGAVTGGGAINLY